MKKKIQTIYHFNILTMENKNLTPTTLSESEMIKKGQEHWKGMEVLKKEGGYVSSETIKGLIDKIVSDVWKNAKEYYAKKFKHPSAEGETFYRKVSVKERLPDKENQLFVFIDAKQKGTYIDSRRFMPKNKEWLYINVEGEEITHWLEPIQPSRQPDREKTIDECLDEIAKNHGHKNWDSIDIISELEKDYNFNYDDLIKEAMTLYASQSTKQPIGVPSDADINKNAQLLYQDYPNQLEVQSVSHQRQARFAFAFVIGAKWLRSQIISKHPEK